MLNIRWYIHDIDTVIMVISIVNLTNTISSVNQKFKTPITTVLIKAKIAFTFEQHSTWHNNNFELPTKSVIHFAHKRSMWIMFENKQFAHPHVQALLWIFTVFPRTKFTGHPRIDYWRQRHWTIQQQTPTGNRHH